MLSWAHVGAAAAASGVLVLLLVAFIWRCCCYNYKLRGANATASGGGAAQRLQLQTGIGRFDQASPHHRIDFGRGSADKQYRKSNYSVFRRGVSTKPLFSWADPPSLVTDAVENGWSGFGFTGNMTSSPSARSALLGLCAAGDTMGQDSEIQIGWEISQGSAELTQKVRLNYGLKKAIIGAGSGVSVATTALPLPGPQLGTLSFPQEAYFEITILYSGDEADGSVGRIREGERAKLIEKSSNPMTNSESLAHGIGKVNDLSSHGGGFEAAVASIGLTGGGSLPFKLPGSFPGSIGFNSNGSVFLDGTKLVFESEKGEWGRKGQVVGCGFDPRNKNVFFTLDSELVHVFRCHPEEFGAPLYPTLAANIDIMVLVNFGQNPFAYTPANSHRTPNPCFTANSPASALGFDDSKELFSMGRIDDQWLNRSTTRSNINNSELAEDFDAESEADLFEIALDKSVKSPSTK